MPVVTPELIASISAFVVAVFAAYSQFRSRDSIAHRSEVALLREEVARLQQRVAISEARESMTRRNQAILLEYIARLRCILIEHNIDIPEMPELETDSEARRGR